MQMNGPLVGTGVQGIPVKKRRVGQTFENSLDSPQCSFGRTSVGCVAEAPHSSAVAKGQLFAHVMIDWQRSYWLSHWITLICRSSTIVEAAHTIDGLDSPDEPRQGIRPCQLLQFARCTS